MIDVTLLNTNWPTVGCKPSENDHKALCNWYSAELVSWIVSLNKRGFWR